MSSRPRRWPSSSPSSPRSGRTSSAPSRTPRCSRRRSPSSARTLVSGGTDNHLMLVDVTPLGVTGKEAERILDEVGITVNKNAIPFDPLPPNTASGIRVGSPAMTTRGFGPAEMRRVGELIVRAIRHRDDAACPGHGANRGARHLRPLPGARAALTRMWSILGFQLQVTGDAALFIAGAAVAAAIVAYLLTPVAIAHRPTRRGHRRTRLCAPRPSRPHRATGWPRGGDHLRGRGHRRHPARTRRGSPDACRSSPSRPASATPRSLALFGGVIVAMVLGFIDDRWQIRARYQFLGQLLLAVIALAGRHPVRPDREPVPGPGRAFGANFDFRTILEVRLSADFVIRPVPILLTTLWIVGMINCINWIDGLDGLSTGVSLIAAVTLGIIAITAAPIEPLVALLCAVLAGSLAGFLPWNFHPARVFIGTAGVMVVGYVLAVLSILGSAKVAVALLVLGVPIIDTFWIIIRRLASGASPFEAGPWPPPPPIAGPGPHASGRGAAHLRHLRLPGDQRPAAVVVRRGPAVCLPGHRHRGRLRVVPADPAHPRSARRGELHRSAATRRPTVRARDPRRSTHGRASRRPR